MHLQHNVGIGSIDDYCKSYNLLFLILKLSMRPLSQKSRRSSRNSYVLKTKLKARVSGQSLHPHHTEVGPNHSLWNEGSKNRHYHTECESKEDYFNQSANKLTETNFNHHDHSKCLCKECECGRHLCKLNVIKPDLSKATIYQKSFKLQKGKPVLVTYAKEYDRFKGPNLEMNTIYQDGFNKRNGDQIQRPHPQDLLHSEGPVQNLTSYSVQFPGHRGGNQYVKPTDRHFRGDFPLRCKSNYSETYSAKKPKKQDYKYVKDNLRTGKNWLGNTIYNGFFAQPNPQYFAKPVKIIEKREVNPDFSLQYRTTYKNHFIEKQTPVCPAKIYVQTKAKGSFSQSKANFTQNSDFKALSPNFHAISTSKHYYV